MEPLTEEEIRHLRITGTAVLTCTLLLILFWRC
jgi:hypothetical protein